MLNNLKNKIILISHKKFVFPSQIDKIEFKTQLYQCLKQIIIQKKYILNYLNNLDNKILTEEDYNKIQKLNNNLKKMNDKLDINSDNPNHYLKSFKIINNYFQNFNLKEPKLVTKCHFSEEEYKKITKYPSNKELVLEKISEGAPYLAYESEAKTLSFILKMQKYTQELYNKEIKAKDHELQIDNIMLAKSIIIFSSKINKYMQSYTYAMGKEAKKDYSLLTKLLDICDEKDLFQAKQYLTKEEEQIAALNLIMKKRS